jgi:hypothetical protein
VLHCASRFAAAGCQGALKLTEVFLGASDWLNGWLRWVERRNPRVRFLLWHWRPSQPAEFSTLPRPSCARGAPLLSGARIEARVRLALERSCRDCHSEDPRYPWYSYVPPVSRLIAVDVSRGRLGI